MTRLIRSKYDRIPRESTFELVEAPSVDVRPTGTGASTANENQGLGSPVAAQLRSLSRMSIAAAVLHGMCLAFALAIPIGVWLFHTDIGGYWQAAERAQISLYDRSLRWGGIPRNESTALSARVANLTAPHGDCARVMGRCYSKVGWSLNILWCIVAWHLVSFVEHMYVAYRVRPHRESAPTKAALDDTWPQLWRDLFCARWGSYAVTAPLMIVCIYVFGYNMTEWMSALFVFAVMLAIIVGGGFIPDLAACQHLKHATGEQEHMQQVREATDCMRKAGAWLGFPLLCAAFLPLWWWWAGFAFYSNCHFRGRIHSESNTSGSSCLDRYDGRDGGECPSWVMIVFLLLFAQTGLFVAFPCVWFFSRLSRKETPVTKGSYLEERFQEEAGFAILSFVSKIALSGLVGWLILVRDTMVENDVLVQAVGTVVDEQCSLTSADPGMLALYQH